MKKITNRQSEILEFIKKCVAENGYPPTRGEIAQHFSFKSITAAQEHLFALERKGYLKITKGISRGIRVVA